MITALGLDPSDWNWLLIAAIAGPLVAATIGHFAIRYYRRITSRPEIRSSLSEPTAVTMGPAQPAGGPRTYSTEMVLENGPWHEIEREMFTDGRPIIVHFPVPVRSILPLVSSPPEMAGPDLPDTDGTTVRIAPLVLCPGQV